MRYNKTWLKNRLGQITHDFNENHGPDGRFAEGSSGGSTSGSESTAKAAKPAAKGESLEGANASWVDEHMKKVMPLGREVTRKDTGERYYVAKFFPKMDIGNYRQHIYLVPTKYKDLGKKAISGSRGLRVNAQQLLDNFKD